MCFGGSKNNNPPPAPAPQPGVINVNKVAPDPSQAGPWRGAAVGDNTSGRTGGSLLLDAASTQPKTTLGGT
jgi:hypothetical protein